jgi:hypothetical protein
MTPNVQWTFPVPSTALLDGGPVFEKRLGREVALRFSYEGTDDERRTSAVVFRGVEAFKCTRSRESSGVGAGCRRPR